MQEFLHQPAVEVALAPFVVALVVAELLQRLRLSGLAISAGFATTVYLVSGFSIDPLNGARKIMLLGVAAPLVALPLGMLPSSWSRPLLTLAGGAAALWTVQRILQQQQTAVLLLWSAGCLFYAGWLAYWMDRLEDNPVRASSAGLALGLGTGLAALFGASASLGSYGLAAGAAAGAYLLLQVITRSHLPGGLTLTFPLSVIAGTVGCFAVLSARLPAYVLPVLAAIPLVARIPVSEKYGVWVQSILLSAASLACAAVAVFLTWRAAGAPPL